jgi:NitT/TauT family transport system substrate-binding protein
MTRAYSIRFCALFLLAISSVFASPNAKTITIAYPSTTWNTSLPLNMGREFGIFAAEGLEVALVYIRGGPVVIAALVSGDTDYAIMAGVTAVTSISRGADLVIVGGHTSRIDQVLMGAKGITKLGDLKGKVIGVTGSGGVTEFATVEALSRNGLIRDRDYKLLYVGTSPTRVRALETGVIHAAPFSATETVIMERQGFPVILEVGKAIPEFPFVVVVANRQKIKSKSAETIALLKALNGAITLIQNDREKVLAAAARKEPGADINVLRKSLSYTADTYSITLTRKNINALLYAAKINTTSEKPSGSEKYFTDEFIAKVLAGQR